MLEAGTKELPTIPQRSPKPVKHKLRDRQRQMAHETSLILLGGLGHGFPGDHGRWGEIYGYVGAFFDSVLKDG